MLKNLIIVAFIALTTLSCSDKGDASWTVLVYMAADNNLTEQAYEDIVQMQKARFPSSVNVIVQLDPNQYSADPQTRRYEIRHDNASFVTSPVIEYLGDIDSGDYLSLADFVNWGIASYPARRYALVIWSHGSGWSREDSPPTRWICPDTHSLNQISIAQGEFKAAFQLFTQKMNILIIDACYMHTMEVVTEVRQYTDFIIGSENLVPFEGFPYKEILDSWRNHPDPEYLVTNIVELYVNSHDIGGSQNPNNFTRAVPSSAAKSSHVNELMHALRNFVDNWQHIADESFVRKARESCYEFSTQVDIKEFFSHLHPLSPEPLMTSDIESVLEAIENVFVAQAAINMPTNATTASIWFPLIPQHFEGSRELYTNLDFSETNWLDFLANTFTDE
jgi:hypothetical protein